LISSFFVFKLENRFLTFEPNACFYNCLIFKELFLAHRHSLAATKLIVPSFSFFRQQPVSGRKQKTVNIRLKLSLADQRH